MGQDQVVGGHNLIMEEKKPQRHKILATWFQGRVYKQTLEPRVVIEVGKINKLSKVFPNNKPGAPREELLQIAQYTCTGQMISLLWNCKEAAKPKALSYYKRLMWITIQITNVDHNPNLINLCRSQLKLIIFKGTSQKKSQ